jgi:FkbM family methyltransferase
MQLKNIIRSLFQKLNLRITKLSKEEYGVSLEFDLKKLLRLLQARNSPIIIFDVGANVGQTISKLKKICPQSQIHAFEPSPECFSDLLLNTSSYSGIVYNNIGLGADVKTVQFYENELNDISSFLEPTNELWGKTKSINQLKIMTLNEYVTNNKISRVNFLKIDTQGYELEVLKGAENQLKAGKIDVIQLEITLRKLYSDLPQMDLIIKYLLDLGYKLVAFYGFHNDNVEAMWTDAIFISPNFKSAP